MNERQVRSVLHQLEAGPLGVAPPTGKSVTLDGLVVDRMVGGKAQERWEQRDQSAMLQQLGFA